MLKGTVFPSYMSPDGRFLLYWLRGQSTRMDVWTLPMADDHSPTAGRREPFPLLNSQFDETGATLSPDGRWLAYQSDVTGSEEVTSVVSPQTKARWANRCGFRSAAAAVHSGGMTARSCSTLPHPRAAPACR